MAETLRLRTTWLVALNHGPSPLAKTPSELPVGAGPVGLWLAQPAARIRIASAVSALSDLLMVDIPLSTDG